MSRTAATAGGAERAVGVELETGYLARSARPLTSLVFVLPFIILYEFGTRFFLTDAVRGTQHIVAFTLLERFFSLFGATTRHLPAFAVVSILMSWHLARKDGWTIRITDLLGMVVESVALSIPLIVGGQVFARMFPLAATGNGQFADTLILSFGAGIYEELVFRLILCTTLSMLLRNVLRLEARLSTLLLVAGSSVAFSAYHYLGQETFNWRIFAFRSVAGVYFVALFLVRGFGVTAGCHIAYDILIVML